MILPSRISSWICLPSSDESRIALSSQYSPVRRRLAESSDAPKNLPSMGTSGTGTLADPLFCLGWRRTIGTPSQSFTKAPNSSIGTKNLFRTPSTMVTPLTTRYSLPSKVSILWGVKGERFAKVCMGQQKREKP